MTSRIAHELRLNREFDKENPNWSDHEHQNQFFLRSVKNQMRDLLMVQGFVTVNELYKALGFDQTEEGALAGWVKDIEIDFGPLQETPTITIELNPNSLNVFRDK